MSKPPKTTQANRVNLSLLLSTSVFFISMISSFYAYSLQVGENQYDLMLVGGGLNTCSSFSLKNCQKNSFKEQDLQSILYQIDEQSVRRLLKTSPFEQLKEVEQENIRALLLDIYAKNGAEALTRRQLRKLFDDNNLLDWYRGLPDALYYALLDSLEVRQVDAMGQRKQERTALLLTKDQASVGIYQRFVEQASLRMPENLKKPHVVVITASSRDPFEVADFYTSVFTQAGADVTWLPIDKTYQQARELEDDGFASCERLPQLREVNLSFYREHIYPKRAALQKELCQNPQQMSQIIGSAQGVFFNGGDQSLTLAALKWSDGSDSPELATIKSQVSKGALIVGGTSAGTAVQAGGSFNGRPVAMLTNGNPENAMARGALANPPPSQRCLAQTACAQGLQSGDLTYRAQGGTGLFELGLLDTHFSERDRESRLAVFTATSEQTNAFGVDEATALLVKNADNGDHRFEVQGANGVFMIDHQIGHYAMYKSSDNSGMRREVSGVSHYLGHGAKATFDSSSASWQFELPGELRQKTLRLPLLNHGEWRDQIRTNCGSSERIAWQQFGSNFVLMASDATAFYYSEKPKICHYTYLPFVIAYPAK